MRINAAEGTIAVLVIAISATFFAFSFGFPHMRGDPGGGALWPRIMALSAGGGSLWLLVRRVYEARRAAVVPPPQPIDRQTLAIIAASIAYPIAIVVIGFALATLLFVAVLMMILRARPLQVLIFAPLLTAFLYGFFVFLLEAVVPRGILIDYFFG